ncbi:MAG: substrate-binding domain-containing protein [Akkermansiaceae bacterium]|nr:substrate-binding domain-containing protein [Akkermansiaceae bacterium]
MTDWHRTTTSKQLADYLCGELTNGRWHGTMPGVIKLAGELGVSRNSVEDALSQLEQNGLLRSQGRGKRRIIVAEGEGSRKRPLRVAFLLYEASANEMHYIVELRHLLTDEGHYVVVAPRYLVDLQMRVPQVARLVGRIEADVWMVQAGSREVLDWFAAQPTPALAMFGRHGSVPIAGVGPNHMSALLQLTRKLIQLGHRRIVMLTRPERRVPKPGLLERAVLAEMEDQGIPVGPYNLPNWDDTREGLHGCLDKLFQFTPPTALIIDEASIFAASQQHLARQGILAPQHVSLVCCDPDPMFAWFEPPVTHMRWNSRQMLRQIVRWVAGVARGQNTRRQVHTQGELVEGGTIGPVNAARG